MPRGQHLSRSIVLNRPARVPTRAVALLALASLGLAGCASRPVAVEPPLPDAGVAEACAAFIAALPNALEVAGERREVDPDSPLTAAYGDPPVAIRCGVPAPAALTADALLVTAEGVDWLPEELTGGWLLTTVDRVANVELTVPTERGPAPSIAAELAPTILSTLPASD